MSELPDRPNLDQLRRQARELLSAAADGEPSAMARIRAVSGRLSLSSAQLAVAREHGFASWPALHAEVERRLAQLFASVEDAGPAATRWSFGGASPIETAAGTLLPRVLVASRDRATLEMSLRPAGGARRRAVMPSADRSARATVARAAGDGLVVLAETAIGSVTLIDDQATTYALRAEGISGPSHDGRDRGLVALQLRIDPVPARGRGWLELRGPGGATARLVPSPRGNARVSALTPIQQSSAARDLSGLALDLIGHAGIDRDALERHCSSALARATEIQRSGEPGTAGELPDQLAGLCAYLTGRGQSDGLPSGWAGMVDAMGLADGARLHLDVAAALPPVDDTVVLVDSLVSEPEAWRLYLRAEPGWWTYSADGRRKWPFMSVAAEDDRGGRYLSQFGGSHRDGGQEELTLRFLPRLSKHARALTLVFSHAGEQATVEFQLP
ncbi:MAG: hypothetical protein ACRDNS_11960 [Trebonia sp.]